MLNLITQRRPDPAIVTSAHAGATLFLEGEPADWVYQLRQGIVRGVSISADGDRQVVAFFFAGDEIGLPLSENYRFCAEAVTDISYVSRSRLCWNESLIRSCREEGRLLPSIGAEQDPIRRRGIIIGRKQAIARMSAFLVSIIDRLPQAGAILSFPLSQLDIAAHLATTPETICRCLRQLREAHVISMPRRDQLVLHDRARLEGLAGGSGH